MFRSIFSWNHECWQLHRAVRCCGMSDVVFCLVAGTFLFFEDPLLGLPGACQHIVAQGCACGGAQWMLAVWFSVCACCLQEW
jgi:hypothetical protein